MFKNLLLSWASSCSSAPVASAAQNLRGPALCNAWTAGISISEPGHQSMLTSHGGRIRPARAHPNITHVKKASHPAHGQSRAGQNPRSPQCRLPRGRGNDHGPRMQPGHQHPGCRRHRQPSPGLKQISIRVIPNLEESVARGLSGRMLGASATGAASTAQAERTNHDQAHQSGHHRQRIPIQHEPTPASFLKYEDNDTSMGRWRSQLSFALMQHGCLQVATGTAKLICLGQLSVLGLPA